MMDWRCPFIDDCDCQQREASKKVDFCSSSSHLRWLDVVNEESLKDDVDMGRDVVADKNGAL